MELLYKKLERARKDYEEIVRAIAVSEYKATKTEGKTIHDLDIPQRYIKVLHYNEYFFLEELESVPDRTLVRMPNFGRKSLKVVRDGILKLKNTIEEQEK